MHVHVVHVCMHVNILCSFLAQFARPAGAFLSALSICRGTGAQLVISELTKAMNWIILGLPVSIHSVDGYKAGVSATAHRRRHSTKQERAEDILRLCSLLGMLRILHKNKGKREKNCRLMVKCGVVTTLLGIIEWTASVISPPAVSLNLC